MLALNAFRKFTPITEEQPLDLVDSVTARPRAQVSGTYGSRFWKDLLQGEVEDVVFLARISPEANLRILPIGLSVVSVSNHP